MSAQFQPEQPLVLYGAGPAFGLPETSPYVMKAMVQLAMAGIPYRFERGDRMDSPKGQVPYLDDAGQRIADSTFIRGHIEARYGVDLDEGLTPLERAQAWAMERMIENQLGWTIAWFRFMEPANFDKGPAHWFDGAPEELRPALREELKAAVAANLKAVGVGRHTPDEITLLGTRSLWALSVQLGDKPYLMGEEPTSVDAIAFATLATCLTPFFDHPLRTRAEAMPNLVAYTERMMGRYFPRHAWSGGRAAA